jgi:hypothetical protein
VVVKAALSPGQNVPAVLTASPAMYTTEEKSRRAGDRRAGSESPYFTILTSQISFFIIPRLALTQPGIRLGHFVK